MWCSLCNSARAQWKEKVNNKFNHSKTITRACQSNQLIIQTPERPTDGLLYTMAGTTNISLSSIFTRPGA